MARPGAIRRRYRVLFLIIGLFAIFSALLFRPFHLTSTQIIPATKLTKFRTRRA